MHLQKLAILLCAGILSAQDRPFSFGVTAGVPITDGVRLNADESRRYTLGVLGEYRFTQHISLLVNPLYRRTGSSFTIPSLFIGDPQAQTTSLQYRERAHNLDLPIMGRYTFLDPNRSWRPFFAMGFSFHTSWRETRTIQTLQDMQSGQLTAQQSTFHRRSNVYTAAVAGAGIDFKLPRFHVLPEFRYSYHGTMNPSSREANQVDFLLSLRF